jgi:hypothetical protein
VRRDKRSYHTVKPARYGNFWREETEQSPGRPQPGRSRERMVAPRSKRTDAHLLLDRDLWYGADLCSRVERRRPAHSVRPKTRAEAGVVQISPGPNALIFAALALLIDS